MNVFKLHHQADGTAVFLKTEGEMIADGDEVYCDDVVYVMDPAEAMVREHKGHLVRTWGVPAPDGDGWWSIAEVVIRQ